MSYNLRYFGEFADYFNDIFRVEIDERNYSGDASEMLMAGETPMELSYPGDEMDVFRPVYGSQMAISVISETDFQYTNLHTADARKFRVKVFKGGVLYWIGWILPDLFAEPYIAPPYPVKITARCGLGELDSIPMPAGVPSYGDGDPELKVKSFVNLYSAVTHCLRSLNLGVNIKEAVNIYSTNRGTEPVDTDTTLTDTYINLSMYQDYTMYGFLEDVLKSFCARIYQQDGFWHVIRLKEYSENLRLRTLAVDGSGVLDFDSSKITTFLVGKPQQNYIVNDSPEMKINPAWKSFSIERVLKLRDSILRNPDFSETYRPGNPDISIPDQVLPSHWQLSGKGYIDTTGAMNLYTNFSPSVWLNRIYQQIPISQNNFQSLKFTIESCVWSATPSDWNTLANIAIEIKIIHPAPINIPTYYAKLKSTDSNICEWSETPNVIVISDLMINNPLSISYLTHELDIFKIPSTGKIEISVWGGSRAMHKIKSVRAKLMDIIYPVIDEDNLILGPPIMTAYKENPVEVVTVNDQNSYIGPVLSVRGGDFPNFINSNLVYDAAFNDGFGSPINGWRDYGSNVAKSLVNHLKDQYRQMYLLPQWVLTLPILSRNIKFDSSIVDYQILSKKYQCVSARIDLKEAIFYGTFCEIGAWEGAPWILADGTWNDDGIWIDDEVWNDENPNP